MKANLKISVLSVTLLFSSFIFTPQKITAAAEPKNGAMTPAQCAAAMKDLQQQSASLSQQLRSCKTNAVCAPLGVRLNRITQQLLSLKRKCSPALPTGASPAPVKKPASTPSGTDGIDLKDASGEVLDLKASWPDIPEFGSADLSGLSASMDTALLPQKAQATGDELPICGEDSTICAVPTVCQKPCASAGPGEPGWMMSCVSGDWCRLPGEGGGEEECAAGKVTIEGPKDLLLSKPSAKSAIVPFKVITTKTPSKIAWSVSNERVKFTSGTNQATVRVIPALESDPKGSGGDVTITVAVDNCPLVSRPLTVRRPASVEHGSLTYSRFKKEWKLGPISISIPHGGTKDGFTWTLRDQFSKPLKGVIVKEAVWCDAKASGQILCMKAFPPLGILIPWPWNDYTTNADGQFTDTYSIRLGFMPAAYKIVVHQGITANGYTDMTAPGYKGKSDITFTESSVVGTSPVKLE